VSIPARHEHAISGALFGVTGDLGSTPQESWARQIILGCAL
jgi:hypothetical protein